MLIPSTEGRIQFIVPDGWQYGHVEYTPELKSFMKALHDHSENKQPLNIKVEQSLNLDYNEAIFRIYWEPSKDWYDDYADLRRHRRQREAIPTSRAGRGERALRIKQATLAARAQLASDRSLEKARLLHPGAVLSRHDAEGEWVPRRRVRGGVGGRPRRG